MVPSSRSWGHRAARPRPRSLPRNAPAIRCADCLLATGVTAGSKPWSQIKRKKKEQSCSQQDAFIRSECINCTLMAQDLMHVHWPSLVSASLNAECNKPMVSEATTLSGSFSTSLFMSFSPHLGCQTTWCQYMHVLRASASLLSA